MKETLTRIVFGPRAAGEKLPAPTVRTLPVTDQLSESEWMIYVKFGSRYGHRGSFYQNNFHPTVA